MKVWIGVMCVMMVLGVGCTDKPSLFPNSDKALRKTKKEFAADAKKRFPYPGAAAQEAEGIASVDVALDRIQLTNQSEQEWRNIDVWVNKSYVVHVPKIEARGGIRTLQYDMFYNDRGEALPKNNDKYRITDVEVRRNGEMYKVRVKMAF